MPNNLFLNWSKLQSIIAFRFLPIIENLNKLIFVSRNASRIRFNISASIKRCVKSGVKRKIQSIVQSRFTPEKNLTKTYKKFPLSVPHIQFKVNNCNTEYRIKDLHCNRLLPKKESDIHQFYKFCVQAQNDVK